MGPGRSEEYLRRFRGLLKVVSAHHQPISPPEPEKRGISAGKLQFLKNVNEVRPNIGRYQSNGGQLDAPAFAEIEKVLSRFVNHADGYITEFAVPRCSGG